MSNISGETSENASGDLSQRGLREIYLKVVVNRFG